MRQPLSKQEGWISADCTQLSWSAAELGPTPGQPCPLTLILMRTLDLKKHPFWFSAF